MDEGIYCRHVIIAHHGKTSTPMSSIEVLHSALSTVRGAVARFSRNERFAPRSPKRFGLLRRLGRRVTRDTTKDDDVGVSIAAQTVRAVRHTGDFTRSPKTRDHLAVLR